MKTNKINFTNYNAGRIIGMFIITLLSFVFGNCSSEEEVSPAKPGPTDESQSATINGKNFATPYGYMFDLGKPSKYNSRDFVVDLANGNYNGTTYSNSTTTIISFAFNSASQSELAEGAYVLNLDKDSNGLPVQNPFTFSDAYAHVGLKYENGNLVGGTRYEEIIGGSIAVKKTNAGYDITYSLQFKDGLTINGVYVGTLKYYDVS